MQKKALGRGLESLMPTLGLNKTTVDEVVVTIPLNKIRPNKFQPRNKFNAEKLQELADSIEKHGLIQPIVVFAWILLKISENARGCHHQFCHGCIAKWLRIHNSPICRRNILHLYDM
ncbi:hypothetical protein AGMMS49592_5800 [Endomicrobiia bacterium]|nr:hypothetical protein AGMMS49592_5800 [Endomicrobiia bacterium]